VQLFVDRAQGIRPDFQVTPTNAGAIAALCQRLEGLPLAIELAAARAGVLTPTQMLARLEQRFELLMSRQRTAARHRSLRAALDWSYHLLTPELQRFFARLSVFRGGWTAAAAEVVCEEPLALEYLEQLRECSLVVAEETGVQGFRPSGPNWAPPERLNARTPERLNAEMRFRLLETLREYGAAQLTPEEQVTLAEQHACYFLELAEEAEVKLIGPDQGAWLDRLEQEIDNLRAAMDGALTRGDVEVGLRITGALWGFWWWRGYVTEGREWVARLVSAGRVEMRTAVRAKAQAWAGHLALIQGDYSTGHRLSEESLALAQELGDPRTVVAALRHLGMVVQTWREDCDASHRLFAESLRRARELGDRWSEAFALQALGHAADARDCKEEALSLYEESLAIRREIGQPWGIAVALNCVGGMALHRGEVETAQELVEESLVLGRAVGAKRAVTWALGILTRIAEQHEDWEACREYLEERLALSREMGDRPDTARTLRDLGNVALHMADPETAHSCFSESLALSWQQADQQDMARALEGLTNVAVGRGEWQQAAQWLGAADAQRESAGDRGRSEDGAVPLSAAEVRAALGEAAFEAAWAAGRSRPIEEVVAAALSRPALRRC
jgi:tetratricopeptide (TPR) repeat protein